MRRNRRGSCRRDGAQRARPCGEAVMSAGLINRPAISNGMLSWSCSHGEPPASLLVDSKIYVCVWESVCCKKKRKKKRGAYGVCVCRGGGGFQHHTFTSTNNLRKNSIPPPRYYSTPSPSLSCWYDRCTTALFLAPRPQHKAPAMAIRRTIGNNSFNATVSVWKMCFYVVVWKVLLWSTSLMAQQKAK